eukprot:11179362-Lingulodinium_polyedra.AAC.1
MRTPQKARAAERAVGLKALHNLRVTTTCARPTVRPLLLALMRSVFLVLVVMVMLMQMLVLTLRRM